MGNSTVKGYTDVWGKHGATIADHTGPASYAAAGDVVTAQSFGLRSVDFIAPAGLSASGTYQPVYISPTTKGGVKATGTILWYYAPGAGVVSVAIASAGTGQTNGTTTVTDSGTNFSGRAARVSITIAGGAITKATIIDPGSGYFGAATFTVAQGGTPGTLSSTVGAASDVPVVAGTNLSAESVRLLVIGG